MNVLEYLHPAVEAVKQQEAADLEAQAERERLILAGHDMAALLLEREVPVERQLHRSVPVVVTRPRRFLWDARRTDYQREVVGNGWTLLEEDKIVEKYVRLSVELGFYKDVTVSDATVLLTDGSFVRHNSHDGTRPVDVMTCEQPNTIKQGLAQLAMRYDLVE